MILLPKSGFSAPPLGPEGRPQGRWRAGAAAARRPGVPPGRGGGGMPLMRGVSGPSNPSKSDKFPQNAPQSPWQRLCQAAPLGPRIAFLWPETPRRGVTPHPPRPGGTPARRAVALQTLSRPLRPPIWPQRGDTEPRFHRQNHENCPNVSSITRAGKWFLRSVRPIPVGIMGRMSVSKASFGASVPMLTCACPALGPGPGLTQDARDPALPGSRSPAMACMWAGHARAAQRGPAPSF